ncbi:Transcriptional regulator [Candidatus Terasakiella magnetica]|nr:Transcriptional regulator [Candidatus Terasakiella magnetica]
MRDASETRRKIQHEALRLFVDRGVGGTTTRDLAQAAGIAEGTLYRHYESKDALVWDLFSTHYATFAHRLTARASKCETFAAKLAAIVAEFCRFFDAEPVLFRFLMLAQHQALPRITNDSDNPVEVVQTIIATAIGRGEIPAQPTGLAATMVLGLLLQPAIGLVYGRVEPPFSQYAETIATACLKALGSDHHA